LAILNNDHYVFRKNTTLDADMFKCGEYMSLLWMHAYI